MLNDHILIDTREKYIVTQTPLSTWEAAFIYRLRQLAHGNGCVKFVVEITPDRVTLERIGKQEVLKST